MSSNFNHGDSKVVKGDRIYKIDHHHIIEENNKEFINISITKNVASMLISVLLLFFILGKTANNYKHNKGAPKGTISFSCRAFILCSRQ